MAKLQTAVIPVTKFQQNCTVLFDSDTREGVVVDPGSDIEKILEVLKTKEIDVKAIWLTHGHFDHAGAAMALKETLGVDIIGPHRNDEALLNALVETAKMLGVDDPMRNCTPDRWLAEGDRVGFGDHLFEVYHTPGHSTGHVIFFHREAGFAQLGDVLFNGSVGRTDIPEGDHATLLNSIKTKVLPLGDDVTFICGHGPGSRIGDERRNNPYLVGL